MYINTRLYEAIKNGNVEEVKKCIKDGADVNSTIYGQNPLHWAVIYPNIEIVKLLVDAGADINSVYDEWTPLCRIIYIAYVENRLISPDTNKSKNIIEIIKYLLKSGVDVNSKDVFGRTPLYFAMHFCNVNIIKCLLEHGADFNCIGPDGISILEYVKIINDEQLNNVFNEFINKPDVKFAGRDRMGSCTSGIHEGSETHGFPTIS